MQISYCSHTHLKFLYQQMVEMRLNKARTTLSIANPNHLLPPFTGPSCSCFSHGGPLHPEHLHHHGPGRRSRSRQNRRLQSRLHTSSVYVEKDEDMKQKIGNFPETNDQKCYDAVCIKFNPQKI